MTAIRTLLAAALLAFAAPAAAQSYWFLGFSLDDDVNATARPAMSGSSVELGAGYRFNRFLAAEASYFNGGGQSDTIVQDGTSTTHFWDSSGFGVAALATVPAGPVSLLGRIGAHKLKNDLRTFVRDLSIGTLSDDMVSESVWAANVGLGAQLVLSEGIALRVMLEQREGKQLERLRSFSIGAFIFF